MGTPIPPKKTDFGPSWEEALNALYTMLPVPVNTAITLDVIELTSSRVEVEVGLAQLIGDQSQVLKHRGEAICDPGDVFDAQIGVRIATGRALEALANRLLRQAEGMVRHADDVAEAREEAALRQYERSEAGRLRARTTKVVQDIHAAGFEQGVAVGGDVGMRWRLRRKST